MEAEHQARMEAIFLNAVDAIITIDETGRIEVVNPATSRLFGYAPSEMIGKNISMLMPSPDHEQHNQYLQSYLAGAPPKIIGIGREVRARRKDGTTFPIHLAVSEQRSENKRLFTGIIRDISDLQAAQEELKRLNTSLEKRVQERTQELRDAQAELLAQQKLATLGQIAGSIAHEIRNPLNAVKTSAYFLLNAQSPKPEKTKEHLQRIDRQVTLVNKVITALTDFARLPEPNMIRLDLESQIDEVLRSFSIPRAIQVRTATSGDNSAWVLSDRQQLQIILRNLIGNALDAMPEGGVLNVGARQDNERTILYVQDTGMGIPPEDLDRIMEPLYSTKVRGMGLGLAICQAMVHHCGASMEVTSEVGRGSTFSVRFPRSSN